MAFNILYIWPVRMCASACFGFALREWNSTKLAHSSQVWVQYLTLHADTDCSDKQKTLNFESSCKSSCWVQSQSITLTSWLEPTEDILTIFWWHSEMPCNLVSKVSCSSGAATTCFTRQEHVHCLGKYFLVWNCRHQSIWHSRLKTILTILTIQWTTVVTVDPRYNMYSRVQIELYTSVVLQRTNIMNCTSRALSLTVLCRNAADLCWFQPSENVELVERNKLKLMLSDLESSLPH